MGVMVVEVRRVSDRVMTVVVVFKEDVLRLICGHAPQSGRSLEEKQSFYDELKCKWDMYFADDLVMCLGDIRHMDGMVYVRVIWKKECYEFSLEKELRVSNTWPKRGKEKGDIQNG